MTIEREPAAHGGLVATHELHARGFDRAAISSAVRAGRIRRQRQGWYSSVDLAPVFARAARVGGVATCATALAAAGVWVLDSDRHLHVAVKPTACQLRSPRDSRERLRAQDVVIHWTLTDQVNRLTRSLSESLLDYAACATPELLAATANSLLREHPRYKSQWTALRTRLPVRTQRLLRFVDGVCESGTEFVFWVRLRRLHARMRRQVRIEGVGRVDFLIGERLVIEIDGFDHHGGRDEFEADRHRDALLGAAGYRSLRFSHKLVFEKWSTVEAAVWAAVARGDHL
jgi:very-short-patch-repair endonuclease